MNHEEAMLYHASLGQDDFVRRMEDYVEEILDLLKDPPQITAARGRIHEIQRSLERVRHEIEKNGKPNGEPQAEGEPDGG